MKGFDPKFWDFPADIRGWGPFGVPTGAAVYILGISHAEFGPFGPAGLRREWTLIDQTAVWKQSILHLGAV